MLFYIEALVVYFFANAIFLFGLNIQFGLAGIVNLAYIAFFAMGAYLAAIFSIGSPTGSLAHQLSQNYFFGATLTWPLPIVIAVLGTALFAYLVGKLVIRTLRPDFAALASVAVMLIAYTLVNNVTGIFNGATGLQGIPAPLQAGLGISSNAYSYVFMAICAVFCALAYWVAQTITRSPLGRTLRATRENAVAAAALGKDVTSLRLLAYVIAGGFAGLAGALFVEYISVWAPAAWSFPETILLFAALYIGGRGNNHGALLGSLIIYVGLDELLRLFPPITSSAVISASLQWVFLAVMLILFIWFRPQGIIPERRMRWKGVENWAPAMTHAETYNATAPVRLHAVDVKREGGESILRCDGIWKAFGGVRAVNDCSIAVTKGLITGLIGPNGAGKSTLLDIIAGSTMPDRGSVSFAGEDITKLEAHEVARRGISRTFQKSSEFARLSVLENMMTAPQGQLGESLPNLFVRPRSWRQQEADQLERARLLLDRFGLLRMVNEYAGNLSGGQLRLLEMARALMSEPKLLLLDEPVAGVNPVLTDEILHHLGELSDEGLTIVLVEHELEVIDRVCDTVLVMANGALLSEGTMTELRMDERVIEAYLA